MTGTVLVRDFYYRDLAGKLRTQRWIGDKCVSVGDAQVVLLDWWSIGAVWTTLITPCTALVKEGPKAMVKYERWAVDDPYLDFLIFMHDMAVYQQMRDGA